MTIEEKLLTVKFNVDAEPHIIVDAAKCEKCADKPCLYVCPVQNYTVTEGKLDCAWRGCVECGACRIVCPHGAIDWHYPKGGFGVRFRYG